MMGLASSGEDDGTALGFFNKLRTLHCSDGCQG
jgi:hypothetical protein